MVLDSVWDPDSLILTATLKDLVSLYQEQQAMLMAQLPEVVMEVVGPMPEVVDKRVWLEVSEAEREVELELDKLLEEPWAVRLLMDTPKCTGFLLKLQQCVKKES